MISTWVLVLFFKICLFSIIYWRERDLLAVDGQIVWQIHSHSLS
jgi:hypothetical protein